MLVAAEKLYPHWKGRTSTYINSKKLKKIHLNGNFFLYVDIQKKIAIQMEQFAEKKSILPLFAVRV